MNGGQIANVNVVARNTVARLRGRWLTVPPACSWRPRSLPVRTPISIASIEFQKTQPARLFPPLFQAPSGPCLPSSRQLHNLDRSRGDAPTALPENDGLLEETECRPPAEPPPKRFDFFPNSITC